MISTRQTAVHDVEEISTGGKDRTKRIVGASLCRTEVVIATLFLVTAAVAFLGIFFLDPILNASDYLARVFPNKGAVELGSLL